MANLQKFAVLKYILSNFQVPRHIIDKSVVHTDDDKYMVYDIEEKSQVERITFEHELYENFKILVRKWFFASYLKKKI